MKKLFIILCLWSFKSFSQEVVIENVRTNYDPKTKKIIVLYDLVQKSKYDSIIVNFYSGNKKIKSQYVNGDLGFNVPFRTNNIIEWDLSKQQVFGIQELRSEISSIKSNIFSGNRGKILKASFLFNGIFLGVNTYNTLKINKNIINYNNINAAINPTEQKFIESEYQKLNTNLSKQSILWGLNSLSIGANIYLFCSQKKKHNRMFK